MPCCLHAEVSKGPVLLDFMSFFTPTAFAMHYDLTIFLDICRYFVVRHPFQAVAFPVCFVLVSYVLQEGHPYVAAH